MKTLDKLLIAGAVAIPLATGAFFWASANTSGNLEREIIPASKGIHYEPVLSKP